MNPAETDRNLLFGILALHNGFIGRDALIRAMSIWVAEKQTPLGAILVRQNDLGTQEHFLIDALVNAQLKQHGGDAAESLASLNTTSLARAMLAEIRDADVQASLSGRAASLRPSVSGQDPPHDSDSPGSVFGEASSSGRFRLLQRHAEGGLGVVSLAR